METPKKYVVRKGTKDSGKDYEFGIAALMSLRCAIEDVEDMWLVMNVENCGSFDDIIIHRKENRGTARTYMIQLKHQDKLRNIVRDQFLSDKGMYSLKKYEVDLLDMLSKINSNERRECGVLEYLSGNNDFISVIFTNNGITRYPFLKERESTNCSFLNTRERNSCYKFNYSNLGYNLRSDLKHHFENLWLYTDQVGIAGVNNLIEVAIKSLLKPVEIPNEHLNKIVQKYVTFVKEWGSGLLGGHYALTKTHVLKKLAELLLEPYISKFYEVDRSFNNKFRTKIWGEIIEDQNVTIIEKDEIVIQFLLEYVIHTITKYEETWRDEQEYRKTMMRTVSVGEKRTLLNDYEYFWKVKKIPLILEAHNQRSLEILIGIVSKFSNAYKIIIVKTEGISLKSPENLKSFKTLVDLSQGRIESILNADVKLQGRTGVKLGDFLSNKGNHVNFVNSRDILHILANNFDIGNPLNKLPDTFLERFIPKIILKPKILQETTNDLFVIKCKSLKKFQSFIQKIRLQIESSLICEAASSIDNNLRNCRIIVTINTDIELGELNESFKKAIHQLILHDSFELEWVKSFGSTEVLRSFRSPSEKINLNTMTVNIVEGFYSNRIKLISAGPGMGKSVLLDYIALETPTKIWVLRINLKDYLDYYHSEKFRCSVATDHLKHFNDSILSKCSRNKPLDKAVFEELVNSKHVLLLFDGFDEIAVGFNREVTKLILSLQKQKFSMWLTTRPVMREYTEHAFDTFAFTLNPFTKREQFDYLSGCYKTLCTEINIVNKQELTEKFILLLLEVTTKNLQDFDNKFLGIPLHTRLLSKVYAQKCLDYINTENFTLSKHFDLISLYENFITEKLEIFSLKYGKFLGGACNQFEKYQQLLALRTLFGEDNPEGLKIKETLYRFVDAMTLQLMQVDGIVVPADELDITFAHRTYMEYMAAKWLSENFLNVENRSIALYLIKKLFDANYGNVRNLFDRILAKNCELHSIVLGHSWQMGQFERLLKRNTKSLNAVDKGGRTFLHLMATRGLHHPLPLTDMKFLKTHSNGTMEILIPGAFLSTVNTKDKIFGYTALDYAAASGCLDVLNAFCAKCENICFNFPEEHLSSYVYYCANFGYVSLLESILKHFQATKVVKEALDGSLNSYQTPLHCAVLKRRTNIVDALLSYGANPNKKDFNGMTPLHIAAENGFDDVVLLLLTNGACAELSDNVCFTPLHRAALNGHADIVSLLLSVNAANLNLIQNRFCKHRYQNLCSRNENHYSGVDGNRNDLLYVNKTDKDHNTALHFSAVKGYTSIVSLLLRNGAEVNLLNTRGYSALHLAACKGYTNTVFVLLSNGAEILNTKSRSCGSLTATYSSQGFGDPSALKPTSSTPLHEAVKGGYTRIVSLLLSSGVDVNMKNARSFTALHEASRAGHKQIVSHLLKHGADVNVKNSRLSTPLHEAVRGGHTGVVALLMDKTLDINQRDDRGYTALHEASCRGCSEVVLLLLSNQDVNVNIKSKRSETPLYLAAKHGHRDIVSLLLSKSAHVNVVNDKGSSVLHKAAQGGDKDIVSLLLSHGAQINLGDSQGRTPLFVACTFNQPGIVSFLLAKNANTEKTTKSGSTVLHEASYNGSLDMVSQLLLYKARVNVKDSTGRTPLHHAVTGGKLLVIKELIKHGADACVNDLDCNTPLNLAEKLNYSEIVKYLKPLKSSALCEAGG